MLWRESVRALSGGCRRRAGEARYPAQRRRLLRRTFHRTPRRTPRRTLPPRTSLPHELMLWEPPMRE